jgi:hypothetical protein
METFINIILGLVVTVAGAFCFRVRGGLRIKERKLPFNKLWFAIFFGLMCCLKDYFDFKIFNINLFFIGTLASYVSTQLYGWGLYIGRLVSGGNINPEKDKECELIDDILYNLHITMKGTQYYLYQYPRLFGFCGTCLTGLIITFITGLVLQDIIFMTSGLSMGVCYWVGSFLEKIKPLGKNGWNYGEWIFGGILSLFILLIA